MITSEKEVAARRTTMAACFDLAVTLGALLAAQSLILLADLLKTAIEFVAVFLAWLAIRRITRGHNEEFEYGLDKLENLSSLIVGLMMLLTFAVIALNAVYSLRAPTHISGIGVWISLAVQVVFGFVNSWQCVKNRRMARQARSPIAEAMGRLFFARAFGNGFIFLSLSSSMMLSGQSWTLYIDPVAALLIASTILISAVGVFRGSFFDLLDRTLEERDQIVILREMARQFDNYDELHGIRSRRAGGREFIEVYLGYLPDKTVREVMASMAKVREAIRASFPEASVEVVLAGKELPV